MAQKKVFQLPGSEVVVDGAGVVVSSAFITPSMRQLIASNDDKLI